MGAQTYRDLDVWKLANGVRQRVIELASADGFADVLWLKRQLVEASASACANVAEGFGRFQPRDFARFVRVARASLLEVSDHLSTAEAMKLVDPDEVAALHQTIDRTARAAAGLIRYLESARAPSSPRR